MAVAFGLLVGVGLPAMLKSGHHLSHPQSFSHFMEGLGVIVTVIVSLSAVNLGVGPPPPELAISPRQLLRRDRLVSLALIAFTAAGLGVAYAFTKASWYILLVVAAGLATFLAFIHHDLDIPWPLYQASWIFLIIQRQLPWMLMSFLEDAHERGILRRAGPVYQFRHIELQHRLAARYVSPARKSRGLGWPGSATERAVLASGVSAPGDETS
jgi:hypothetical protein